MPEDDRPSISKLLADRAGWPAELYPILDDNGTWDGRFAHSDSDSDGGSALCCSSFEMDEAPKLSELLATQHNVMPVLLEIAAAALAWKDCTAIERSHEEAVRACLVLMDVVARVRS